VANVIRRRSGTHYVRDVLGTLKPTPGLVTERNNDGTMKYFAQVWMVTRPLRLRYAAQMRFAFAAFLIAAPAAASGGHVLFAGGHWAAIDFGSRCEARTAAMWAKASTKPYAGFAFDRSGPRQGQFYVHLSRPARAGATVVATIGSEPFLLVGKGEWAWSSNPAQQKAILRAARYADWMRIDSRDGGGSRIIDRYTLAGAPTAIDASAAACAGKSQ
jgi:hypothetical protein